MSEKDPIQNHGDTEEWTSYAPNCTLRLTKAALTQETGSLLQRNSSLQETQNILTISARAEPLAGISGSVGAIRLQFNCISQ